MGIMQEIDEGFFTNLDGEPLPKEGHDYVLLRTAREWLEPRIKKAIKRERIDAKIEGLEGVIEKYRDTILEASRKGKQFYYVEETDIIAEIASLKEQL